MARVGLAMSGGGYRAAAFSLGVVHYLNDTERIDDVCAVSSVSGGSITNASLSQLLHAGARTTEERRRELAKLSSMLAHFSVFSVGSLISLTLNCLAVLAFYLLLILLAFDVLANPWIWLVLSLLLLLIFVVLTVQLIAPTVRGRLGLLIRDPAKAKGLLAIDLKKLFSTYAGDPQSRLRDGTTTLGDLIDVPFAPVFCTTDLATGNPFYLSNGFVSGSSSVVRTSRSEGDESFNENDIVSGTAPDVQVSEAVAASAAFPGLMPPRFYKSETLGLPVREGRVLRKMCLADGGLRDNLGIRFFTNWHQNELPEDVRRDLGDPPNEVIVVNSGVPQRRSPRSWPFRRLRSLLLSVDVIHQANTRGVLTLERARLIPGTKIATVSISGDPCQVVDDNPNHSYASKVATALSQIAARDPRCTQSWWHSLAQQANPAVKTNLKCLGAESTARLMFHGYVCAMVETAVRFGWIPPERVPTVRDFEDLCKERTRSRWRKYEGPLAWGDEPRPAQPVTGT